MRYISGTAPASRCSYLTPRAPPPALPSSTTAPPPGRLLHGDAPTPELHGVLVPLAQIGADVHPLLHEIGRLSEAAGRTCHLQSVACHCRAALLIFIAQGTERTLGIVRRSNGLENRGRAAPHRPPTLEVGEKFAGVGLALLRVLAERPQNDVVEHLVDVEVDAAWRHELAIEAHRV